MAVVSTHEKLLYQALKNIFPEDQIYKNVTKDLNFKYPVTGGYMEFDVWIPKYQLCFEFQDSYHYNTVWYFHNTKHQEKARQNGMTLIAVPFWWKGQLSNLVAEIKFYQPDIMCDNNIGDNNLIPLNPPELFSRNMSEVPDSGELMLVSHPHYNFSIEDHLWWMGEKYDGVRCCWNPNLNTMYTRYGNEVSLLPSMINSLPLVVTDNELWLGRGQYYFSCCVVKENQHFHWPMVRTMAFDVLGDYSKFEKRYEGLLDNITFNHPFNLIVPRILATRALYNQFAESIINNSGEGVILQRQGSLYEPGRSPSLVKIKTTLAEQEAIVVELSESSSVLLKLPNERTFEVAVENANKNIKVGDIVTFSFESRSRQDMPINPRIERIRHDINWDNVVHTTPHSSSGFITRERGYWNDKRIRQHMVDFATGFNLDPLRSDTWIKCGSSFRKSKEGRTILSKFKNTYYNLLKKIFPEVSFDAIKFQRYIWRKVENRRLFFEKFAQQNKFDPLQAEHWYDYKNHGGIMAIKGARGVLSYHNFSISKAIQDLFPNIGIDKAKLKTPGAWNKRENRRRFFEDYATSCGFDPLKPSNWYNQSRTLIMASKGAPMVMMYHGGSVIKALIDLFPDIGLDKQQFIAHPGWCSIEKRKQQVLTNFTQKEKFSNSAYFINVLVESSSVEQRRAFFERFAQSRKFDPYQPDNWYLQSPYRIMALKGAHQIISFHNNSVSQALLELFPNIGLDVSKL